MCTSHLRILSSNPKKLFLSSGQFFVATEPSTLVTILGSCVAVCLWDIEKRIGGMNHFMLPETVNDARSLNGGIASTRLLVQSMINKHAIVNKLQAKIFGGANRFFSEESFLNVGKQNVQAAINVLEESGIALIHQDTGGEPGRKIYFNTLTGDVRVETIHYNTIPIQHRKIQ